MANRLPSLQSLLILDAAARLGSFTRAAEALALTHSAVSQQIGALQKRLGVRLFVRDGQGMRPTAPCLALVGQVRQSLALLDRAFSVPTRRGAGQHLTVTALPHFAIGWLIARLPAFRAQHPRVVLDLVGSHLMDDLSDGNIDAAIRFGQGGWPGLTAEFLAPETSFLVAAPGLIRDARFDLSALDPALLLRCAFPPWETWLQTADVQLPRPPAGAYFGDPSLLLTAVRHGQGIGLARAMIVADDLREGRLARLSNQVVEEPYAYYLVWRPDSPRAARIREFGVWLKIELAITSGAFESAAARSR